MRLFVDVAGEPACELTYGLEPLMTLHARLCRHALADVGDDHDHLGRGVIVAFRLRQPHLDRHLRSVRTPCADVRATRGHRPRPTLAPERGALPGADRARDTGHEVVDRHADELLVRVAEQLIRRGAGARDRPVAGADEHHLAERCDDPVRQRTLGALARQRTLELDGDRRVLGQELDSLQRLCAERTWLTPDGKERTDRLTFVEQRRHHGGSHLRVGDRRKAEVAGVLDRAGCPLVDDTPAEVAVGTREAGADAAPGAERPVARRLQQDVAVPDEQCQPVGTELLA